MVELADTLGLGSSAREGVRVRLSVRLLTAIQILVSIAVVNRDLLYYVRGRSSLCDNDVSVPAVASPFEMSDNQPHDYLTIKQIE